MWNLVRKKYFNFFYPCCFLTVMGLGNIINENSVQHNKNLIPVSENM